MPKKTRTTGWYLVALMLGLCQGNHCLARVNFPIQLVIKCSQYFDSKSNRLESVPAAWDQALSHRWSASLQLIEEFGGLKLDRSSSHGNVLESLGFEKTAGYEEGKVLLAFPKDAVQFFDRAKQQIEAQVSAGVIKNGEAIYPALRFKRKSRGALLDRIVQRAIVYVRPGIDPIPDAANYEPDFELSQIPQMEWEDAMAQGKMPFSIDQNLDSGGIVGHDIGHLTGFIEHPSLMAATRRYYQRTIQSPTAWRKMTQSYGNVEPKSQIEMMGRKLGSFQAKAYMGRVLYFGEFLDLFDHGKKDEAFALIPHLVSSQIKTVEENKARLLGLAFEHPEEFKKYVDLLLSKAGDWILSLGGANRDGLNFERFVEDGDGPLDDGCANRVGNSMILNGQYPSVEITDGEDELVPKIAISSLKGQLILIKKFRGAMDKVDGYPFKISFLTELFNQLRAGRMTSSAASKKIESALIDLVARFEIAVFNGMSLELSPEQFVDDSSGYWMNTDSKAYRWVDSFANHSSALWQFFASEKVLDPQLNQATK